MLKVIDRFTTRDGSWEPSDKPFSITPVAAAKYANIPGRGAAHHIFVHVPQGAGVVEFNTADRKNRNEIFVWGESKWVNFPIWQGYNPDKGEVGAWGVWIDGEKVADGLGLPYGWHVSTFLVVEDKEPQVEIPPGPSVPGQKERWTLYRNGALVFDSEG
jgi:hypothetical protein